MAMQNRYYVSAVIKDRLCEDRFIAKSERQAWFLLGNKYSFAMRDFKVLGIEPINDKEEQLSFSF